MLASVLERPEYGAGHVAQPGYGTRLLIGGRRPTPDPQKVGGGSLAGSNPVTSARGLLERAAPIAFNDATAVVSNHTRTRIRRKSYNRDITP